MDESSLNPDRVLMEELQENLTRSAEVGKHLLEEREMLREQMEAERNEYTAKIEVYCLPSMSGCVASVIM